MSWLNFPLVPIVQWYLGVWAEGCNQKQWVPETGTDHSLVYGSGGQQSTVRCSYIACVRTHSNLGIPVVGGGGMEYAVALSESFMRLPVAW